nr:reverse transcriptase domain-containing protein [Tanacetum cinerariifolium]
MVRLTFKTSTDLYSYLQISVVASKICKYCHSALVLLILMVQHDMDLFKEANLAADEGSQTRIKGSGILRSSNGGTVEPSSSKKRSTVNLPESGSSTPLRSEKLSRVIKELKQGKDQPKMAKKEETSVKDKAMAILMVQLWQRVARQRIMQSFSQDPEFLFLPLGNEDETKGPMIIEAEIGGHFIHRMYMDGGSASEILCKHCFNRLRPEVRRQMFTATIPLVGFSRDIIWPMGKISLLVKIGVKRIQAVSSTAHGRLKFLVPGGILTLRSSRIVLLECTMVSRPKAQPSDVIQTQEERIKVTIHPEYPEQTIATGFTLTEEGWRALCDLLRHNLDIFS